jgi:aryl-alcohol dehydrogenase-like predicted oxidoreductase
VKEAWRVLLENGVNWIDTAQAYGSGESERICADLFEGMPREDFIIQTKWYVVPNTTKYPLAHACAVEDAEGIA